MAKAHNGVEGMNIWFVPFYIPSFNPVSVMQSSASSLSVHPHLERSSVRTFSSEHSSEHLAFVGSWICCAHRKSFSAGGKPSSRT